MRELVITANHACRFIFVFVGLTGLTSYQLSEWLRCQGQPLSSLVMSQLCGLISPGKSYCSFLLSLSGLNICRSHYNEYVECCKAKNVEAKTHPPKDWKGPKK